MAGTFHERILELKQRIGGPYEGSVTVDQVYAKYQHEDLSLHHPMGGQARYLIQPLIDNAPRYLADFAHHVFGPPDADGRRSLEDSMEDLAGDGGVATHAPVEFADLRASGAPKVKENHLLIYDRPPHQHRLTEEEIKAKRALHPTGWVTIHGHPVFVGTAYQLGH